MIYEIGMQQVSKKLEKTWLEIRGEVKVNGKPATKRIAILDRRNLRRMAIRYSNKDGMWFWRIARELFRLKEIQNRFMVLAIDDTKIFDAQVHDYITPVLVKTTINLGEGL